MYDYQMKHICSYSAQLNTNFEMIGAVPEGYRFNAFVEHGKVTGPKIQGKIRPVGGDWACVRTDGVLVLDVRGTIETDDGALIHLSYKGVGDFGEQGYEDFSTGNLPKSLKLRCAPMVQCSHPDYQWLNRLQLVNVGEIDFTTMIVSYDTYALV